MESHPRINEVRAVGIPAADQDRALDFYAGKLGFEKRLEAPMPGGRP
jgi:lactoylglutathione lyase